MGKEDDCSHSFVLTSKGLPTSAKYCPSEEFSAWMVAMILVGCAFVLFIIVNIYLMCKSPGRKRPPPPPSTTTAVTNKIHTLKERNSTPKEREHLTASEA